MQKRIPVLDGIRGIAILMILIFHYINNPLATNNSSKVIVIIKKLTEWGWAGVDLFFVLSGFLIGTILFYNRKADNYFKTFYIRRFFRIIPTYLLLLIIFYALKFFFNNPDSYIFQNPLPIGYYLTFTQNFIMGIKGTFGSEGLGPTWSLAIEEQFYILTPLLIYLVSPSKVIYWLLFFVIAAPIFRLYSTNWYMSYTWFFCRMDSLGIGVISSLYVYFTNKKQLSHLSDKALLLIAFIILFIMLASEIIWGSMGIFKHTLIALFFALIILYSINAKGIVKNILSNKLLIWFGLISYPLYLFHLLFEGLAHQLYANNLKPRLETKNDLIVSALALAFSIVFSKIVHIYIEQPAILKGKMYKYNRNEQT
jgi:peptidoglycan/LPS O-acetylase OafA/YrhL